MPEFTGGRGGRTRSQLDNEVNLKDNGHEGALSKKSIAKLRNALNWLISSAKMKRVYSKKEKKAFWFKVNFITLTVPPQANGIVSEKLFKKALHAWLIYAQKYFYLKNYVWKVESHEDGRLHVHLCTDTFIHYNKLRTSWNKTLDHNGLLDSYFLKFGNKNPPSTDVHATRKVNDVVAYICEYMAKKPTFKQPFSGRIWSCNYELSHKNQCKLNLDPTEMAEVTRSLAHKQIKYSAIESKPDMLGQVKHIGELYIVNQHCWSNIIKGIIKDKYDQHRFYIRSKTQTPPMSYFEIEYFSEKNISEYQQKSEQLNPKSLCKTNEVTPKTGQMKYALLF
jgi:hypothetical protein